MTPCSWCGPARSERSKAKTVAATDARPLVVRSTGAVQ